MKILAAAIAAALLSGCTTISDPAPTGKDRYMVGASNGLAMRSSMTLHAAALERASEHCKAQGKISQVETSDTKGVQGLWPTSATVMFRCVDP